MSTTTNHTRHNCLQSLFDTLIGISQGYEAMIERAEPSVRAYVADFSQQHDRDIREIERIASEEGFELDHSGTVMGNVHKTAVKLRDLFSDIDKGAMQAVADGEENVVKRYDDAIKSLSPEDTLHTILTEQRNALRSWIATLPETA